MAAENADNLEVELAISDDRINPTIDKARSNLTRFVGEVNATKITIGQHLAVDFATIENRTNALRVNLQDIAKARISAGNIGTFTKEIVSAGERVRTLQKEIADTQKLLEKPHIPAFTQILQRDLKAATTELAALESKLNQVGKKNLLPPGSATTPQPGRGRVIGNAASSALSLVGAPELTNILAIAQDLGVSLEGAEVAIAGMGAGFLATAGAAAIAGAVIIKYSIDAYEQAKKQLKLQESITVEFNKQHIAMHDILENLPRETGAVDRYVSSSAISLDELKRQAALFKQFREIEERLQEGGAGGQGGVTQELNDRINASDARINAKANEINAIRAKDFQESWDAYVKNADEAKKAQEAFNKSVEDGKIKARDLTDQLRSVFEGLSDKLNSDNPFTVAFNAGERALDDLDKKLKSVAASPELTAIAENMQRAINSANEFKVGLGVQLSAFSLQETADKFRNPTEPVKPVDLNKQRRDFLGPAYRNFDDTQIRDAYETRLLNNSAGIFTQNQPATILNRGYKLDGSNPSFIFNSALDVSAQGLDKIPFKYDRDRVLYPSDANLPLNQRSLITSLANDRLGRPVDADLTVQQRLDKQFGIVDAYTQKNAGSKKDFEEANRSIIALSQGLNPKDLTNAQRERVAVANENEARRLLAAETTAKEEKAKDRELQQKIADNGDALLEIAKKFGDKGIEALIRVQDETTGKKVKGVEDNKRPSGKSTDDYYNRK